MAPGRSMDVRVEYLGLLTRLAGLTGEIYSLKEGSSLQELMEAVLERRPSLQKGNKSFFIAINKKAISAARQKWSEIGLQPADTVIIGVKIIGG